MPTKPNQTSVLNVTEVNTKCAGRSALSFYSAPCRFSSAPCRFSSAPCRFSSAPCRFIQRPVVLFSALSFYSAPCRFSSAPCRFFSALSFSESPLVSLGFHQSYFELEVAESVQLRRKVARFLCITSLFASDIAAILDLR